MLFLSEKTRSQEINTKMLSFFRDKSVDSSFQVFETVRVFVTDANDEPPEFQNLPFIIDIPEVHTSYKHTKYDKRDTCHRRSFLGFT